MDEAISSLEDFIRSNPDARELKRAIAVKMKRQGHPSQLISELLSVSLFFVRSWNKMFQEKGIDGIKLGYQGSKKYLTEANIVEVMQWLKTREYWHLDELVNHVALEYGVLYKSKQSYYELFTLAKISWKKSQKINPKFDGELVKKKREEINHFLAKKETEIVLEEIVVLFLDECHLLYGDMRGYVWGKTNIRIEIPIENEKKRQTYFGALDYKSHEFTIESYPSGDGDSTVKFIKQLQKKYKNKKLALIWDGASYHRFGKFRDYLEEENGQLTEEDWRIKCILFAPNAPEQNPVEDIWLQAKNCIRKYWHLCSNFKLVKSLFEFYTNQRKFDFPKTHQYHPASLII